VKCVGERNERKSGKQRKERKKHKEGNPHGGRKGVRLREV